MGAGSSGEGGQNPEQPLQRCLPSAVPQLPVCWLTPQPNHPLPSRPPRQDHAAPAAIAAQPAVAAPPAAQPTAVSAALLMLAGQQPWCLGPNSLCDPNRRTGLCQMQAASAAPTPLAATAPPPPAAPSAAAATVSEALRMRW